MVDQHPGDAGEGGKRGLLEQDAPSTDRASCPGAPGNGGEVEHLHGDAIARSAQAVLTAGPFSPQRLAGIHARRYLDVPLLIGETECAGNLLEPLPQGLCPSVRPDCGDHAKDRPGQDERDGRVERPPRPQEHAPAVDDDDVVEEVPRHPTADGPGDKGAQQGQRVESMAFQYGLFFRASSALYGRVATGADPLIRPSGTFSPAGRRGR